MASRLQVTGELALAAALLSAVGAAYAAGEASGICGAHGPAIPGTAAIISIVHDGSPCDEELGEKFSLGRMVFFASLEHTGNKRHWGAT